MRVLLLRLRSVALARRGASRTQAATAGARIASCSLRGSAQLSSASTLDLRRQSSYSNVRSFSVTSKFPTQDESAILAHADDDHDPNASQLVCGSCNTPISQTKDLIFFKWKNGIHLSSMTDAPLRNLHSQDHWDEGVHWKKHKLHCLKCGNNVGTIAKVFASDKILFSAKHVAIQMPANQSPLISVSGYPSSQLGFSYWTELILMLESQPSLKDALAIRRIDQIRDASGERKMLNRKLLLAKDLRALLRVVDEHSSEMNTVNISTALDRASRFVANQTTTRTTGLPRLSISAKSEAPEDELLNISSHLMARPRTAEEVALEKKRFWDLIQLADNLVNFSIAPLKGGYEIANFLVSLMRLGVGRKSILEPIAKQALFVLQGDAETPAMNAHEASIIAGSIVHLCSKAERDEPWVTDLLHATAELVLAESARKGEPSGLSTLVPLVRSFVIAHAFHGALFALLFDEVAVNGRLEHALTLSPHKLRALKSKMYQVHLDCELNNRPAALRLTPAQVREYKEIFASQETHAKNSSFRLQHLVSTALVDMRMTHDQALALDAGYAVDIALPRHQIAIEINGAECYQVVQESDESDSSSDPASDKPLGFVDLKARHLEDLGWVVIQLRADKFQQLETVDDRARYLSVVLEVATNARRQQQQQ